MALRRQQQSVHRGCATGLLVCDGTLEIHDLLRCLAVDLLRLGVGQEVREVGTDHDQRLLTTPDRFQHLCHFGRAGITHRQGQQLEVFEHRLQKGQMYFQRMFLRMRRRADYHLRQRGNGRARLLVDFNLSQRGGKEVRVGQGQPANRHPMHWPEQDHTPDAVTNLQQSPISQSGRGATVDVAGVRHDEGLGAACIGWRLAGGQQCEYMLRQDLLLCRIESAGNSG